MKPKTLLLRQFPLACRCGPWGSAGQACPGRGCPGAARLLMKSVSTYPGAIALTRTPRAAHSALHRLEKSQDGAVEGFPAFDGEAMTARDQLELGLGNEAREHAREGRQRHVVVPAHEHQSWHADLLDVLEARAVPFEDALALALNGLGLGRERVLERALDGGVHLGLIGEKGGRVERSEERRCRERV